MQVHVTVPVVWPSQARLDEAWRRTIHDWLAGLPPLDHGYLKPGGEGAEWRLTAGEHLAPGARYEVADSALTVGDIALTLGGTPANRTVRADYQDRPGRGQRFVHIDLDGLDACRSLRTQGDLHELRWTVVADVAARLLDARVELDWAHGELRLTAAGDSLDLHLEVEGRGLWRPTIAPLLAAAKGKVEQGAVEILTDIAESLVVVESDGRWTPAAVDEIPGCQATWAEVRRRLLAPEDATAAAGWGRRTGKRWRAAYDALPPLEDLGPDDSITVAEGQIADEVTGFRMGRRRLIDRLVDQRVAIDIGILEKRAEADAARSPGHSGADFRVTDEDLAQLHVLGSPLEWLREGGIDVTDPGAAPGSGSNRLIH